MARSPDEDPFSPGYGVVPTVWAGRADAFADRDLMLSRLRRGAYEQARLISGDRGVGKTAFLSVVADDARDAGDLVAQATAARTGDLGSLLADALRTAVDQARPEAALARRVLAALSAVQELTILGTGVQVGRARKRPSALADAFYEAARMAATSGHALLLTVDEAQNTPPAQFAALWVALQEAQNRAEVEHGPRGERVRRHAPLAVFLAALPGIHDLAHRAGVTFAERVRHHDFGLLSDADIRDALEAFAANHDVAWDAEALDLLVPAVGGYPYFLHLLGTYVWRAGSGDVITARDVRAGLRAAATAIATFYGERLRGLGDLQHDWLVALAKLPPDERTTGAVARALGRDVASLGSTVAALRDRGLVKRLGGRGRIDLSVPNLDRFLRGD